MDYFVLQICWRWVEKKIFKESFIDFNPLRTKITLKLQIARNQRKNRVKVCNITKTRKS